MFKTSLCVACRHLDRASRMGGCKAFPDGIPDHFIAGDANHLEPVEGDHGIIFEMANDLPASVRQRAERIVEASAPDQHAEAATQSLFFYGTLCNPATRHEVLGHDVPVRYAMLPGYRKTDADHNPGLVEDEGDSVQGVVLDATALDQAKVKAWEAEDGYTPGPVTLADGTKALAFTRPK
jgi:hypothetical protein